MKSDGFRVLLLVSFLIGFVVDLFFMPGSFDLRSDARLFFLVLLWIVLSKVSNFTSMATFKVTIGLLVVLFFLYLFFRESPVLDRAASFLYIFLCIGVVQQFLESRKHKLKPKNLQ